jgi:hypothetical protein
MNIVRIALATAVTGFAAACSAGASLTWREGAPCPIARFEAMGAAVGGELVVLGGFVTPSLDVTASVQIYDPVQDRWRDSVPLPDAQTHVGVTPWNGGLALAGGFVGRLGFTTPEVWFRRTSDGSFTPLTALPSARAALALLQLQDGLHAIGGLGPDGVTDTGDHLLLSPNGWIALPPLPNPRNHLGGAALGSVLFIIGGRHGWNEAAGDQASTDEYDPTTSTWRSRAPFPQPASEIAASTFATETGRIVVVGGSIAAARPTAAVFMYDPGTDAWTQLPDLPAPRKGAVAVAIGNEIIVTTGSPTGVDPSPVTWRGCCVH